MILDVSLREWSRFKWFVNSLKIGLGSVGKYLKLSKKFCLYIKTDERQGIEIVLRDVSMI